MNHECTKDFVLENTTFLGAFGTCTRACWTTSMCCFAKVELSVSNIASSKISTKSFNAGESLCNFSLYLASTGLYYFPSNWRHRLYNVCVQLVALSGFESWRMSNHWFVKEATANSYYEYWFYIDFHFPAFQNIHHWFHYFWRLRFRSSKFNFWFR